MLNHRIIKNDSQLNLVRPAVWEVNAGFNGRKIQEFLFSVFFFKRLLFCEQTCDIVGGKHAATSLCSGLSVASQIRLMRLASSY